MLRIFTLMSQNEILNLEQEHKQAPHERAMQKALAKDITTRVHSHDDYLRAIEASEILFGKGTAEMLRHLSEQDFLSVFEGVPQTVISKTELESGITALDIASVKTGMFSSKGEARRMISQGGLSINKEKVTDPATLINTSFLINSKYILLQKGKKGYFIVKTD